MLGPADADGTGGVRSIAFDNRSGARELGRALGGIGYRQAVVIGAAQGVRTSDDRIAGFVEGFSESGRVGAVLRGGFTRDDGYALAAEAITRGIEPGTVLFGISDVVAIGAMSAIRDAGRAVGDDMAVAGFDDIATGRDIRPGLTTVRVPLEELGYRALHAATDAEWDEAPPPLPLEVVVRGSTPPRG
jgi:LacI family transcriptional regulator